LENLERAKRRGAPILAEIRGASVGCDAWRITDPGEGGIEAEVCVRNALADAGVDPGEVDTVVAHGTCPGANDRVEAEVLRKIFALNAPRIITPKAAIGHLSMACGAVETVLAVKCLQEGCLAGPRSEDWGSDPECRIGANGMCLPSTPRIILKPSFGFGGQNACVVFSAYSN